MKFPAFALVSVEKCNNIVDWQGTGGDLRLSDCCNHFKHASTPTSIGDYNI